MRLNCKTVLLVCQHKRKMWKMKWMIFLKKLQIKERAITWHFSLLIGMKFAGNTKTLILKGMFSCFFID